tara:strand:- start:7394 stop:7771 length:378 start_codon:yes stop_codon:yes gene_type:complete
VAPYEKVRKALATDQFTQTKNAATSLAKRIAGLKKQDKEALAAVYSASKKLSNAKDLKQARLVFGELSRALMTFLTQYKEEAGLQAYSCPMAKGYKKWFQADKKMANPYMGKSMPKCGSKTKFTP